MPSKKILIPLEQDHCYHIYNRGNNREKLFYTTRNYYRFLEKYQEYLQEHVDTYAYCLLPNHFHFLIRVKTNDVSKQFQKMFQSHALAINYQENRAGSLFRKPFRRIHVYDNNYLKWMVFYVHYNPENHEIVSDFRKYPFSSYQDYLLGVSNIILEQEVIEWFGDKVDFYDYHQYHYGQKEVQQDKYEE